MLINVRKWNSIVLIWALTDITNKRFTYIHVYSISSIQLYQISILIQFKFVLPSSSPFIEWELRNFPYCSQKKPCWTVWPICVNLLKFTVSSSRCQANWFTITNNRALWVVKIFPGWFPKRWNVKTCTFGYNVSNQIIHRNRHWPDDTCVLSERTKFSGKRRNGIVFR